MTKGTGTDRVHGTRFQINKDSTGHIFAASSFIVVDIDTFQLEIRVAVVCTSGVNSVFIRNDFPELGTNLINII